MAIRNLIGKIPGAPNFQYREFVRSDTALRKGIKNEPTEQEWVNIESLASRVIQPIRTEFGRMRITSGFRSKVLNVSIGGSETSNHCRGEASDIEPIDTNIKLVDIIVWAINNLEFRNVILEYAPDGWIHIDYREGHNIKRIKLKDDDHDYEIVTVEQLQQLYG